MRWGSVWLVVGMGQIATCAPVSLVLKERLDIFSDNLNGPVTILRTRSTKHISTEISAPRVNRNKLSQSPFEIISPPNHPIDPVFFPPLSKHGNSKLPSLEHEPAAWEQLDVPGDEVVLEVPDADVEATFESFARPGMPCHNAVQPQERNDMLIIYLAASFLLVVVTVETLGSYKRRRQGAIRLGEQNTSSQPPSIRADPELVEFLDEKQAVWH